MDSHVSNVATTQGGKEPSRGNMKPLVGHALCSSNSKKSATTISKKARNPNPAESLNKLTKRPRVKCEVCCRGFQKERALLSHKQSHISGAFSERYSETSAPCGSQGSVALVQRYVTLNIALAMKLRESRFYDRDTPAKGVSKHTNKKMGLKQVIRTKKLDEMLKPQHMDVWCHPQSHSDQSTWKEGMTEATQSSSTISSWNFDDSDCMNFKNTPEISATNASMEVKSKESSKSALEMVSTASNILETDSPDVQLSPKLSLKTVYKDNHVYTNMTTGDGSPKALTWSDQKIQQPRQLDTLNQESNVTAMHDRVVGLVTSLQGDRDKQTAQSLQCNKTTVRVEAKSSGEESECDSNDVDDCYTNLNNKSLQPPVKRRRNRAKQSTFCDICQKDFENIKRHLVNHYGERNYKCTTCGKAFYEARVLEKHETTHVKKFKCSVCGETFSKVREAKRHARIHLPDKPYSCAFCKMAFPTRNSVLKHMNVHSSVKRYVCDICGQGLRSITALNSHKRKHTGEKPITCKICAKSFRYSSGLRVHSFSHTTGKPYPCPICKESFAHNYLRKRHLLTHQADRPSVSHGEVLRSLSLDTGHAEQEDLGHPSHKFSSNSKTNTSRLYYNRASSSEEPLRQAEQMTPQASSHLSTQPSSQEDKLMCANQAVKINQVLGPNSFNLLSGPGSRRQTPVDSLVVPMCDGSYKSLKDLKRQEKESKQMMQE